MKSLEEFMKEQDSVIREHREKTLINAGLVERKYSPDNKASYEYPHCEYDSNGDKRYYRDVAIKITDEQWQEVLEKNDAIKQMEMRKLPKIIKATSWIMSIIIWIVGLTSSVTEEHYWGRNTVEFNIYPLIYAVGISVVILLAAYFASAVLYYLSRLCVASRKSTNK